MYLTQIQVVFEFIVFDVSATNCDITLPTKLFIIRGLFSIDNNVLKTESCRCLFCYDSIMALNLFCF